MTNNVVSQDEIIEMARQAGFETMLCKGKILGFDRDGDYTEELEAFAKLVASKEREACESIEYGLAKSPAMFATMAEYKAYKDGVQDYRTKIIARGEA